MSTADSPETDAQSDTEQEPDPAEEYTPGQYPRERPDAGERPRGASNSLGGVCPDCGYGLITRLRADVESGEADARYHGTLRFISHCEDCNLYLEGETPSIRLMEVDV